MTAEVIDNFTSIVATLPNLDEFPEESREKFQAAGTSTRITTELVSIFEQYFIATVEEVERFKKKNDPLLNLDGLDSQDEGTASQDESGAGLVAADGQGSSKLPARPLPPIPGQEGGANAGPPTLNPGEEGGAPKKPKSKKVKSTAKRTNPNKKNVDESFRNPVEMLDSIQKNKLGIFLLDNLPTEFIYSGGFGGVIFLNQRSILF